MEVCARVPEYSQARRPLTLSLRLGHAVRRRRQALGLTKAETTLRAGIAPGTLRSIERGDERRRPRAVLERLALALGVNDLRVLAAAELLEHAPPSSRSTWPPDGFDFDALDPIEPELELVEAAEEPIDAGVVVALHIARDDEDDVFVISRFDEVG